MTSTGFSSSQVCRLARITYRQLDHWERIGLVSPSIVPGLRGSGHHRRWSHEDVVLVAALANVSPPLRRMLAESLRGLPLARWIVIVGDWAVRVCETPDELLFALSGEDRAIVVCVETLVEFDAAA